MSVPDRAIVIAAIMVVFLYGLDLAMKAAAQEPTEILHRQAAVLIAGLTERTDVLEYQVTSMSKRLQELKDQVQKIQSPTKPNI